MSEATSRLNGVVWERIGAAAGILFAGTFLAAFGLELRDFPDPGVVAAGHIAAFVESNRSRLGLVAIMYAVSWTAFLWFMGSLRSALAKVERTQRLRSTAFGGGVLAAGLFLAFSGLQLEILFADFTALQEAAVTSRWVLFDASGGLFGITPFPRAVLLGAASLVILRHGGLPRWLGWFGFVGAVVNLVGGFDNLAPANASFTGHPLADLMVFLLWVLLASGILIWSPAGNSSPTTGDLKSEGQAGIGSQGAPKG